MKLQCDPEPPATAEAWIERFEGDWPKVEGAPRRRPQTRPARGIRRARGTRTVWPVYRHRVQPALSRRGEGPDNLPARLRPVEAADHDNTARLKQLLASPRLVRRRGRWAGRPEAARWLMVQHADDDPDFQRMVLGRLEKYLGTPRIAGPDYALLWDRVAIKDERPQRYASQMNCKDGKWTALGEVEEPEKLDERRARMDLPPFEDYLKVIIDSYGPCQG